MCALRFGTSAEPESHVNWSSLRFLRSRMDATSASCLRLVEAAQVSDWVKERALRAFRLLGRGGGARAWRRA